LDKFNEQLQDEILSGNVMGALDKYTKLQESAKLETQKRTHGALTKALTDLSEKPYYEDIYQDMEKTANELVAKGYPPDAAAETAYFRAKADHLEKTRGGGSDDDVPLSMASGGKRPAKDKTTKLPEAFERAYERDKQDGLVKDRQDFVNSLSPQVRAQHGL